MSNDAYSRWPAIKSLLDNPPRPHAPPAPPLMQVIRGGLIYDASNPPAAQIAKQKAAEAAAWGFIFVCFALATVLAAVGLVHGS